MHWATISAGPFLNGLWRTTGYAVGKASGPVTTDHFGTGMRLEPRGDAIGATIRQKIDGRMRFQINQNSSLSLPFAPSPVVDAHRSRPLRRYYGPGFQLPRDGVGTGLHTEPGR